MKNENFLFIEYRRGNFEQTRGTEHCHLLLNHGRNDRHAAAWGAGFEVELAKLSSQTSSATVAYWSSLRCHLQTALVSLTILSRPCPKLASRNTERCADL
jgi:hypothetical protein